MTNYMTRDYSQETSAGGGGKKFLYTGPRKRSSFEDDDVDTQKFTYNNKFSADTFGLSKDRDRGGEFDLDSIWSVKNNIGVQNKPISQKPGVQDGWDRGSKGFYSRHGGPTGGNPESSSTANGVSQDPSGKTWPRAYNAYSYTSPSGGQPQQNTGSAALSKDFQPVSPRQSGTVSIHNVTSPVNVSAGGGVGFRGSARNSVQRRNPGQGLQAKHFDF